MKHRQAVLQKGIDDAKKEAITARQQAKLKRLTAGGHAPPSGLPHNYKAGPPLTQSAFSPSRGVDQQTVTFDLRNTHTVGLSQEMLSSDMRSPSMLQLSSHPHTSTTPGNTMTPGNRGSRIPVRSKAGGRNGRGSQISKPTQIIQHNISRPTQPPEVGQVMCARPVSPPVPTVAKRLRQQGQHTVTKASATRADNDGRSGSPSVPALARKVQHAGDTFTKLPHISPPAQAGGGRAHSPPVPALRKKNAPSSGHTHLPPLVTSDTAPLHKQGIILHELSKLRKVRKCGLL